MFTNFKKKLSSTPFVYPWQGPPNCSNCTHQFTVLRRKKLCMFCHSYYCGDCILRRNDKKLSCHKCDVLMTRPLDRKRLLNLRSRDLVNYLSSRHISTSGCIEKEDLVNAVLRSVNEYTTPASATTTTSSSSSSPSSSAGSGVPVGGVPHSCPASPTHYEMPAASAPLSRSEEDVSTLRVREDSTSGGSTENGAVIVSSPGDSTSDSSFVLLPSVEEVETIVQQEPTISLATASTSTPPADRRKCPSLDQLTELDELELLNVRELKVLLVTNRISIQGCVEREELMDKARRLVTDYRTRREDLERLEHSDLCKICMDGPIECVLLECGHMATCLNCGKQLSDCPICRRYVVRCVRTFKA